SSSARRAGTAAKSRARSSVWARQRYAASPQGAEHTWQPLVSVSCTAVGPSYVDSGRHVAPPWLDWVVSSSQGARCTWLWARPPSQAEDGPFSFMTRGTG